MQPYDYQLDWAEVVGAHTSIVLLKARQLGASTVLGVAYPLWFANTYPGSQIALFSQNEFKASVLIRKMRLASLRLGIAADFTRLDARFANGSYVRAYPSTPDAGIGLTLSLAVFDEAAAHEWGSENYAAALPALGRGGQLIIMSTIDPGMGGAGWFPEIWRAAEAAGYQQLFAPWNVRPGRDVVWLAGEKARFTGVDAAFGAYYPLTPHDAFTTPTGLVYPQFDYARHVKAAPCMWADYRWRVAGVDWGGGDPTAIVTLGVTDRDHVHEHSLFYKRGTVTDFDVARWLAELHNVAPFNTIECDGAQPSSIATLRALGLPARAANKKREEGLGKVAFLLENDRLTIEPSHLPSIAEFATYRWKEHTDPHSKDRYATSTPVDHHADAMDARRYAVIPILNGMRDRGRGVVHVHYGRRDEIDDLSA